MITIRVSEPLLLDAMWVIINGFSAKILTMDYNYSKGEYILELSNVALGPGRYLLRVVRGPGRIEYSLVKE